MSVYETMTAARNAQSDPRKLLRDLRAALERYEREYVHFWKGLVNRWNHALEFSRGILPNDSVGLQTAATETSNTDTTNIMLTDIKIYSTAEWGARPPRRTDFLQSPAKGIIVHNTEDENRAPLIGDAEKKKAFQIASAIQDVHLKRKTSSGGFWADTGQNFTISRGGIIMEGRHGSLAAAKKGKVIRGAHANSNEHNISWFGIELEGHYVLKYEMTAEQWNSLIDLCAHLSIWGGFDATNIKGHKEVSATDCPGLLMNHLAELKLEVEKRKREISNQTG